MCPDNLRERVTALDERSIVAGYGGIARCERAEREWLLARLDQAGRNVARAGDGRGGTKRGNGLWFGVTDRARGWRDVQKKALIACEQDRPDR